MRPTMMVVLSLVLLVLALMGAVLQLARGERPALLSA
jgi:hypothetical protein